MSDLLSIGGSAVAAYQRALGTVSNNIANLTTVGYSRQEVDLAAGAPQAIGPINVGTGVQIAGVKRQYDQFVEGTLRNAYSGLNTQGPLVQYANRIVDVMGSESVGFASALDQFFASAQALSGDPASIDLRGQFLRDAGGVANRLRELSSQLTTIDDDSKGEIQADIAKLNTLSQQLAYVNTQLLKNPTVDAQPPELLDQRDSLLRDMSKLAGIHVTTRTNGEVDVSIGNGGGSGLVVEGGASRSLGASFSDAAAGKVDIVLDPYGKPTSIPGLTSGGIGGLISFRQQALEPAQSQLDSVAATFVNSVNQINREGVDLNGNTGGDLFALQPIFRVDAPTSPSEVQVSARIVDQAAFAFHDLQLSYDDKKKQWIATDTITGDTARGANKITINGTELAISRSGQDGETVMLHADRHPAASIQLVESDPRKIAAAALFRVNRGLGNTSGAVASIALQALPVVKTAPAKIDSVIVNNPHPSAGVPFVTAGFTRLATIPAGYSDISLYLDGVTSADQNIQVFTKDGRQVIGKSLATDSLLTAADHPLMSAQNGFTPGATYSETYLNKSGAQGYRGLNVFYGVRAVPGSVPILDAASQKISGYRSLPALIDGTAIKNAAPAITGGAISLNGEALLSDLPASSGGRQASDIADWINSIRNQSHLVATYSQKTEVPADKLDFSLGVIINDKTISACADADSLVAAINGTANVGVTAALNSSRNLVITSTTSADIKIGSPASRNGGNAFGLENDSWNKSHVTATVSHKIEVPAAKLNFSLGVIINGQTISACADADSLVKAINSSANVGVTAALNPSSGNIVITSTTNADITIGSPGVRKVNAFSLKDDTYHGQISLSSDSEIRIALNASGTTEMLQGLGLRPGAYLDGAAPEDLLVFATGSGSASVAAAYTVKPYDAVASERQEQVKIQFTSATNYTITDLATSTVMANRQYDPAAGIQVGGRLVKLSGVPAAGDVFMVDGNQDGVGDNQNIARVVGLKDVAVTPEGKTIGVAYNDLVSGVGAVASQATVARQAMQAVSSQAEKSRDQASGVNLDQEAADLVRYQQAYQAAAKTMQVASQLFDYIAQIR